MLAARKDLTIEQGSTFHRLVRWTDGEGNPVDLSDWSARMQVRKTHGGTLLLDLSTSNGKITLGSNGQIEINATADDTDSLSFERAIYDLELTPPDGSSGTVRLLEGYVYLNKQVTVETT